MPPEAVRPGTLGALLARAAEHPETGLRLLDRRERAQWLPWREVWERARRTAAGLQALGIAPGERVALVFPTGSDFFRAFFGTLLAGAVPVPLYPPARFGQLEAYIRRTVKMLRAASIRLVLAPSRIERLLSEAVAAAGTALGCRVLDGLPAAALQPVVGAPDGLGTPDDLGLIQFSSGTTSDPKPVALTHRAILSQVRILNDLWPDTDGAPQSGVSWLPLYHDMGLIGCVFPALERPGTLTLISPEVFVARPAVWLRALSRYRASISVAPNFAYGLCADKIRDEEMEGVDLSAWRIALNGAEAVAPAALRAFQHRFARWGFRPHALTPVYGLAEASLGVTFSRLDAPFVVKRFDRETLAAERRAIEAADGVEMASVGRPLPGFALRIEDARGRRVVDGQIGRVAVRGPSLMRGYLDQPEATRAVLREGWLDTGDLGFIHAGELYLSGRAKDVVVLRGRNYAPSEIEQATAAVPGVRAECAVAVSWVPDAGEEEILLVFAEHDRDASAETRAVLPRYCIEAVLAATGLRPFEVVVLKPGTLPRTSSGKLRRGEALQRYLSGALVPKPMLTVVEER